MHQVNDNERGRQVQYCTYSCVPTSSNSTPCHPSNSTTLQNFQNLITVPPQVLTLFSDQLAPAGKLKIKSLAPRHKTVSQKIIIMCVLSEKIVLRGIINGYSIKTCSIFMRFVLSKVELAFERKCE